MIQFSNMFLYSFNETGGRIAIDATYGTYSDFLLDSNGELSGKLNATQNLRFNVLVELTQVQNAFTKWSDPIYYSYPGTYYITAMLQDNGPFDYYTLNSIRLPITVTDGKILINNLSNFIKSI